MPFEQFNLGQSMRTGEAIKAARTGNALADLTLQNTKQMNALAPQIAAGDEHATRQGLAVDPDRTAKITDSLAKMNETQRARMKEVYTSVAKVAAMADTPEKWNQGIDYLAREFGTSDFEKYRDQFQNRQAIINNVREVENILGGEGKPFTLSPGQIRFGPDGKSIASVPRDPNSGPGAITPPQQANNGEIDSARRRLQQLEQSLPPGVTLDQELQRRMSSTDPRTGRQIVDYNSHWGKMAWLAAQSKTGNDPDQDRWSATIMGQQQPGGPMSGGEPVKQPKTVKGRPVDTLSVDDIDAILNGQDGVNLTPEEITAIDERLKQLGY